MEMDEIQFRCRIKAYINIDISHFDTNYFYTIQAFNSYPELYETLFIDMLKIKHVSHLSIILPQHNKIINTKKKKTKLFYRE